MQPENELPTGSDARRLESSQTGSTWFYQKQFKLTISWLLILVACAIFMALKD